MLSRLLRDFFFPAVPWKTYQWGFTVLWKQVISFFHSVVCSNDATLVFSLKQRLLMPSYIAIIWTSCKILRPYWIGSQYQPVKCNAVCSCLVCCLHALWIRCCVLLRSFRPSARNSSSLSTLLLSSVAYKQCLLCTLGQLLYFCWYCLTEPVNTTWFDAVSYSDAKTKCSKGLYHFCQ